jgi:hypothetical protein
VNGKPEKWCGRCGGSGKSCGKPCQCPRDTPIPAPVRCGACGGRYSPKTDGSLPHHGSIGWSCNGEVMKNTVTGAVIQTAKKAK